MSLRTNLYALLLPAVSLSVGCGGPSNLRPDCPVGTTSLDGTCVQQSIADYVGCVRSFGGSMSADSGKSLAVQAGYAGASASTTAEVKDKLEKSFPKVSDANALEIIRNCYSKTAQAPSEAHRADPPAPSSPPAPASPGAPGNQAASCGPFVEVGKLYDIAADDADGANGRRDWKGMLSLAQVFPCESGACFVGTLRFNGDGDTSYVTGSAGRDAIQFDRWVAGLRQQYAGKCEGGAASGKFRGDGILDRSGFGHFSIQPRTLAGAGFVGMGLTSSAAGACRGVIEAGRTFQTWADDAASPSGRREFTGNLSIAQVFGCERGACFIGTLRYTVDGDTSYVTGSYSGDTVQFVRFVGNFKQAYAGTCSGRSVEGKFSGDGVQDPSRFGRFRLK